jgi:predicted nucleic acid-binding protein
MTALVRTAVDSSVLLDVFSGSSKFGTSSREALKAAELEGSLLASEVVWAEVRAHFSSRGAFERAMSELGISFDASNEESATLAGEAWKAYRNHGGRRSALVPDFLIAAHAVVRAERLLTRDRGFTRAWFPRLVVIGPTG